MKKELIVRSSSNAVDFALLKDGRLVELHRETEDNKFAVGDIFLAKIRKALPGLNAAFVDVGYEKDGFLHYHDLGPQVKTMLKYIKGVGANKIKDFSLKNQTFEEDIEKNGSIADVLHSNQSILVQVVKEPISTKGPRLSSELSLAGRYIVLVPFSDRISVLRDGKYIGTYNTEDISEEELISYMVGRKVIYNKYPKRKSDEPMLEVNNISKKNNLLITGGSDYHAKDYNYKGLKNFYFKSLKEAF